MKKVRLSAVLTLSFSLALLLFSLLFLSGCAVMDRLAGNRFFGEHQKEERTSTGQALLLSSGPADYYWPWIDHARIELSSGEVIEGPDIFESDYGFIKEYAINDSYVGQLVFRVEESDVFSLKWINLQLDVDYFQAGQWVLSRSLTFSADDFIAEAADDGLQEYSLNLGEQAEGFAVNIKKLQLGKETGGSFSTEPLNYVAFEIEMKAVKSP